MRLTNAEIVQYFRDITEIINRREKYPVRFSFALLKNYRALEPENRNIEEARNGCWMSITGRTAKGSRYI